MSRIELIKLIEDKGWRHTLLFGGDGPYFEIKGTLCNKPFRLIERIPVFLENNHSAFWYALCKHMTEKIQP